MRISLQKTTAVGREECVSPILGDLLPDYIAELLPDSEKETFERHLVDCCYCSRFLSLFFGSAFCRDLRLFNAN